MPQTSELIDLKVEKLVHGGQAMGVLPDGKKAFVWNALPGELVRVRVLKKRKDYVDAVAVEIIEPSAFRIDAIDEHYLSSSPWQILHPEEEGRQKLAILSEAFLREHVTIPEIKNWIPQKFHNYRNKMEYSFFGDESGLHLALHGRGTHGKIVVSASAIAMTQIDETAHKICQILESKGVRASDLKTVMLRTNQQGHVVAALFVKNENFPRIESFETVCKGVTIVYSNPKSPASVRTKDLYKFGDISLSDAFDETEIYYDVFSFFQVNTEVFEQALSEIRRMVGDKPVIDLYSGVGTIGVCVPSTKTLIENENSNIRWAEKNVLSKDGITVVHSTSESALEYVNGEDTVIVDPPRAGLHQKLIERLIDVKPPTIVYLSCNPSTQARDLRLLAPYYEVREAHCFNFFPRTPHIESLVHLVRR